MTYHDILDSILDTQNTTVGGGSASALAGAQSAGLIGMVALLSIGKGCGKTDEEYRDLEQRCRALREELLAGAVTDTQSYSQIVAAYKLPKATDQEKAARRAAIEAAGIAAASAPRDNGFACKQGYGLALSIQGKSNPNAASDLACALGLAKLGIEGCVANIEANLSLIKDDTVLAGFKKDIAALRS